MTKDEYCPCGADLVYQRHCGKIHDAGAGLGTTAESLMRARYCAYVKRLDSFLLESWHPTTRPDSVTFDPDLQWLGLEVVSTERGGALDTAGEVEFVARFRRGGQFFELQERSRFERLAGLWHYLDGK